MENQLTPQLDGKIIEQVLVGGDLSKLSPEQRTSYYSKVCESLGLNPLTKPFDYIVLNGKMQLYARKDCTEQLRSNRKISLKIVSRENINDVYIVTAQATLPDGRCDESIGAVNIKGSAGDGLANAIMKCETKAKRRVTLSICGLGMLDETELETVNAGFGGKPQVTMPVKIDADKAEVIEAKPAEKVDNSGNYTKILMGVQKNIGKENLDQILKDNNVNSIEDIKDKETFDRINVAAWKVFKAQKATV